MRSLRLATFWMSLGRRRETWPSHILSVSLSLKPAITKQVQRDTLYNVKRYRRSPEHHAVHARCILTRDIGEFRSCDVAFTPCTFREMRLPGGENAVIDRAKLTEYCLAEHHPRGKHKARVFSAVLGLTARNADLLRAALLRAAATGSATPVAQDRFGARYVIDFEMGGPGGTGMVRSTWILRVGESTPRLTSCYLL